MRLLGAATECWPAFWRGATQPAMLALLIAFGVTILGFGSFVLLISPQVIAGPGYRYLMVNEFDTHANVTHKVFSLRPATSPSVVVLGTSITHRCIEGEEDLAAMIAERWGKSPEVYDFTMDGQTPWEMAALVERLGRDFNGVLVIGVTPGLLSFGIDDGRYSSLADVLKWPKLGFVSPVLDQEAVHAGLKVPLRTGIYAWDNAHFFLVRRYRVLMNLASGGKTFGDVLTRWSIADVDFEELWRYDMTKLPDQTKHYEFNVESNLAVLTRLVDRLQSNRNISAMVLESPINPRWRDDPEAGQLFKRYQEDIRQFSRQHALPYVPITGMAHLLEPDFYDYEGHLGTFEGRARCSEALAGAIAEELLQR